MKADKLIYKMLTTSTGTALMDSGGADGRHWQKNQSKSLKDFQGEPTASVDAWDIEHAKDSSDLVPTVSTFHYLTEALELDALCNAFNRLPSKDWDSELAYGLSKRGERFLAEHELTISNTWNSYNGESNLSQTLQGANVHLAGNESQFEYPDYILLQIHQGADVRGGYTDAKLFKVAGDYFTANPSVYGTIDGVEVDTSYNRYNLTNENGEAVPVTPKSKINLYTSGE